MVLAPDAVRVDTTRAREPDQTGSIERDGVRVFWERYGDGAPTVLLMPTWSLVHSRHWKAQVGYLARLFRVVTFDGRGNGRSDRPPDAAAYADTEFVADALAVLDATGTDRAVVAGLSMGAGYTLRLAAEHPDRVRGAVFIGSSIPILDRSDADEPETQVDASFEQRQSDDEDWNKYNGWYWRRDFHGFVAWFVGDKIFTEPHSTKQIEDCIGWALETDAETLIATEYAPFLWPPDGWERDPSQGRAIPFVRRVRCPSLVIHGLDDRVSPPAIGQRLARELQAPLVAIAGGGHAPQARWPVLVNRLIRDFVCSLPEAA